MKSQADIIYNHIVKAESDTVETVSIDYIESVCKLLTRRILEKTFEELIKKTEIEKRIAFNVITLSPYFSREIAEREKELGISSKLWSREEHLRFENYFMEKYRELMK